MKRLPKLALVLLYLAGFWAYYVGGYGPDWWIVPAFVWLWLPVALVANRLSHLGVFARLGREAARARAKAPAVAIPTLPKPASIVRTVVGNGLRIALCATTGLLLTIGLLFLVAQEVLPKAAASRWLLLAIFIAPFALWFTVRGQDWRGKLTRAVLCFLTTAWVVPILSYFDGSWGTAWPGWTWVALLVWLPLLALGRVGWIVWKWWTSPTVQQPQPGEPILPLTKEWFGRHPKLMSWFRQGPERSSPYLWRVVRWAFWLAALGTAIYLSITNRPWGLIPGVLLLWALVFTFVARHQPFDKKDVVCSTKPIFIGWFFIPLMTYPIFAAPFVIWLAIQGLGAWFMLPMDLVWSFEPWGVPIFGALGLITAIPWVFWTGWMWPGYNNWLRKDGMVKSTFPRRKGPLIVHQEASLAAGKIASISGMLVANLFYINWDANLQFGKEADTYNPLFVPKSFTDKVGEMIKKG